jgi:hypothetical protein
MGDLKALFFACGSIAVKLECMPYESFLSTLYRTCSA